MCTRAVIIARGELIFSGTPRELSARSRYHNAATVVVSQADAPAVSDALKGVNGVAAVEQREAGEEVRITAIADADARPASEVQERLKSLGLETHEFFIEHGHLDEVFRTITTGAAPDGEVHRT